MNIDQDFVPTTIVAAVDHVLESITEEERTAIVEGLSPGAVHHTVGRYLRNGWSLWDKDTPLKRDAAETYGIAHADDITGLILAWSVARVRGEQFDPARCCQRFHDHWKKFGIHSLTAGGWPPKT